MLQEIEEEQQIGQEPLSPGVEELLRELQSGSDYKTRREAAEQLGKVDTSSPRIVQALIVAKKSDSHTVVRVAAAKALRTPVHQECLQKHPQVRQSAERIVRDMQPVETALRRGSSEPSARQKPAETTLRRGSSEPSARQKPAGSTALLLRIAVGILLVGTGVANLQSRLGCFLIPAGLALIGWFVWEWRTPRSPRNMFLRSMKEAPAEIVKVHKEEHRDYDGDKEVKYYLTVLFRAVSTQGTNRDILLSLKVGSSLWRSAASGQIWTIRYSAEDPTIALIQGEW